MKALNGIRIDKVIVHEVDPRQKVARISADELKLIPGSPFDSYLVAQLERALRDSRAKDAIFRPPNSGIESVIDRCFNDVTFIGASQDLAVKLFSAMLPLPSVKEGTLVVVRFTAQSAPGREFVALLKADLSPAFLLVPMTNAGNLVFTIEEAPEALPALTNDEGLQKAAIFSPPGEPGREILLLDRQARPVAIFLRRLS